jgi:DUF4097 and DUF4098 domain-containing protein YvlB
MNVALRLAAAGLAVVSFTPAPASAQLEGRFERSLTVSGPVTLSVGSGSGSIKVSSGGDGTVRVVGIVRGNRGGRSGSDEEIARAIKAVETTPPIVQQGSNIKIGAVEDEEISRRISISYDITVPPATTLTARTGSGSQTIGPLSGAVTASTGSGSIAVGIVDGEVEVRTGSGEVDIAAGKNRVRVSTGSGSVKVGRVSGAVSVNTGSGSVTVEESSGGTVDVSSGSGSIDVNRLNGGLEAHTASGSIRVAGTPSANWDVHTSSGTINLAIPDGTAFRVQASTSSGQINTDHQLTVTSVGRRELQGSVGSGGPLIEARTSSGSIHIRKNSAR